MCEYYLSVESDWDYHLNLDGLCQVLARDPVLGDTIECSLQGDSLFMNLFPKSDKPAQVDQFDFKFYADPVESGNVKLQGVKIVWADTTRSPCPFRSESGLIDLIFSSPECRKDAYTYTL